MNYRRAKKIILLPLTLSLLLTACPQQDHSAEFNQSQDGQAQPAEPDKKQTVSNSKLKRPSAKAELAQPQAPLMSEKDALRRERRATNANTGLRDQELQRAGEQHVQPHNTEDYAHINENPFLLAKDNPLSTFSIDVDTASYSNVRRFIESNQSPPSDAVRIEELINYFPYQYPAPTGEHPFTISSDLAECPWNSENKLLRLGLRGKTVSMQEAPPANLVFLLDVSGSMNSPNKLPLLKRSLKLVVDQMREQDHISIVVYAGAAGLVLPPTDGSHKDTIIAALDKLQAGGSTAGAAGLELAYQTAQKHFLPEGNNRIILATDGDFNVGPSSDGALERLIEEKRKAGVFLTVLGFGMGNYKDNKMEILADKGNGNYAYLDNLLEARKVLVEEMGSTLLTIAKDVKLQLEFNPAKVQEYRLIGYENRMMAAEDFDDDTKDAGELGAGTRVTALYEIVPAQGSVAGRQLKYQNSEIKSTAQTSRELLTVKLRYKAPTSDRSTLLSHVVLDRAQAWNEVNSDFRFAAAVAGFGMQLRKSEHRGQWQWEDVIGQARAAQGSDRAGYRQNFIQLAQKAQLLQQTD